MSKKWAPIMAVAVLAILAATGQVEAQTDKQDYEGRILTDKFAVQIGGLASNFTTEIAAGNVLGTVIRLEDVLGFEEDLTTLSLSGFYRLGTDKQACHRVRIGWIRPRHLGRAHGHDSDIRRGVHRGLQELVRRADLRVDLPLLVRQHR